MKFPGYRLERPGMSRRVPIKFGAKNGEEGLGGETGGGVRVDGGGVMCERKPPGG